MLLYFVIGISIVLPFGIMGAFSNKIEPHHQMFEEYLEIPLQLTWNIIPKPREGPGRSAMITNGFGLKSDSEVVQLYRTQQMFNVLLSSVFRSVLISFHHIGLLATVVVLVVFAVKYGDIMREEGPAAYAIVFSCILAPMVLIYFQCKMGGAVVDISEDFKFSGQNMFPRRTVFRKFAKSCRTFYIEVTYPFYTIHKETFTMFGEQVIDWSMDLLLS